MKRMMHALHGFHHPANSYEEQAMLAAGWVYDDGEALRAKLAAQAKPKQAQSPAEESAAAGTNTAPEAPTKRGPGRPRKP